MKTIAILFETLRKLTCQKAEKAWVAFVPIAPNVTPNMVKCACAVAWRQRRLQRQSKGGNFEFESLRFRPLVDYKQKDYSYTIMNF